ncbi:Short-chain dehydrogenase/reductase [Trema orientale]|uniref:Short-chain dehydrogenase/reductase n=1 Tax=Trema orientale TaxID=63057 RepID=A0A2P5EBM7_TREOI|nr:Short-chain dehydrogenase/reductase [Trema orientale]
MAITSLLSALSRRLEGKVALITGGASGIGKRTAEVFAHHGAKLVIADIQDELGHSVCQSIGAQNDVTYVHCDVTDESQVKAAVEKAVKAYGRLDIMFNNAGVPNECKPRIIDNDKADFERVLRVNITGVFLGIKHAAQAMIPARGGSIISTASVSSCAGGIASHAYTCSKHAVVGLTRNAAVELGQFGIRVNCLSPYGVATPFGREFIGLGDDELEGLFGSFANLKGVTLKAEDVANAALFLACEEGRYVSGHNLVVDGGVTIVNPSFGVFRYPDDDHHDQA